MSTDNSPQNEEPTPDSDAEAQAEQMHQMFTQFFDNFFANIDKKLDETTAKFEVAQTALQEGDEEPLLRAWKEINAEEYKGDMVADNHALQVARLLADHLVAQRRWSEAQLVFERALDFKAGLVTQRFELFFSLADVLRMQDKNDEAYILLREHPLTQQIEKISRGFPGSDTGARLAHARFDFAEEARLHLLAFEPSPLLPIASLAEELRGDEAIRRLKAALAFYWAGQISRALEQAQQASEVAESGTLKVTALRMLALWQAPRQGWNEVIPLLDEAQRYATSTTLVAQVSYLRALEAVQRGDLTRFEQLTRSQRTDDGVRQQRAEILALQGKHKKARDLIARLVDTTTTGSSPVDDYRRRSVALLGQLTVELYAAQSTTLQAGKMETILARVKTMLRGDTKLTLWASAYEMTFKALHQDRSAAEAIAQKIEEQWTQWNDDTTTLITLSTQLGTTFLHIQQWEKAVHWFERYLEIGKNPLYRAYTTELLARAFEGQGNSDQARKCREEVIAFNFDIKATYFARQALQNENLV